MKKLLLVAAIAAVSVSANAQSITITASDMPVNGDTLRWSSANALTAAINTSTTGANTTWDFSTLIPVAQGVDDYKLATSINPIYAAFFGSFTCYGFKVADSIPGLGAQLPGFNVSDVYTFYNIKTSPSRFIAEGFGASLNGTPVPASYSQEDRIYKFPLTFSNTDSANFKLAATIPMLGSYKQDGYRKTVVDGWGTIKTPFTTSPVQVIRVRSEIVEVDSVNLTTLGLKLGIPRTTVEYKWLANGQHYPMLYVIATKTGGTETVNSVRYRDTKRQLAVPEIPTCYGSLQFSVYPNPATDDVLNVTIPAVYTSYSLDLYDMSGKLVKHTDNSPSISVTDLAHGTYLLRASSGSSIGFQKVTR